MFNGSKGYTPDLEENFEADGENVAMKGLRKPPDRFWYSPI